MQNNHRETLLETYENTGFLCISLGHENLVDSIFKSVHQSKQLESLTDTELVELINMTIGSLLSLRA